MSAEVATVRTVLRKRLMDQSRVKSSETILDRMLLTLFSGLIAAVAGWLYALDNSFVSQDLLGLTNSLNGLLYALVGGAEHVVLGPLLGAAGFRTLTDSLGRLTSQSALYIGLALLIVVYLMPSGILGVLDAAITPRFVWLQRAIVRADVAGRPKYR